MPSAGYLGPEALAEANLIIDEAAEAAGRVPTDVRRLYNISGSFTGSGDFLQGPPRQWVEELTELAITEGIGTFILGSDDPEMITIFAAEVVRRTRGRGRRTRPAGRRS